MLNVRIPVCEDEIPPFGLTPTMTISRDFSLNGSVIQVSFNYKIHHSGTKYMIMETAKIGNTNFGILITQKLLMNKRIYSIFSQCLGSDCLFPFTDEFRDETIQQSLISRVEPIVFNWVEDDSSKYTIELQDTIFGFVLLKFDYFDRVFNLIFSLFERLIVRNQA